MIVLPTDIGPVDASPSLIDFGGFLEPALGGEVQRIDRLGNRFAIKVKMPPLESVGAGRIWVSRLISGKTEGVRMEYPLLSFDPGAPGAPVVNGNGQAGRSLNVRGFSASYVAKEGQFFTHVRAGRCYLYKVDADTTATAGGQALLPITPMLRVEPVDGDQLLFAQPVIEGFVHGDEWSWNMRVDHMLGLEFEVRERA